MNNSIYKEQFLTTNFVKPLYKVKFTKTSSDAHNIKLVGNALNLTKNGPTRNITFKELQKYEILPGASEVYNFYDLKYDRSENMVELSEQKDPLSDAIRVVPDTKRKTDGNKHISFNDSLDTIVYDNEETWLRVHPAPVLPDESIGSIMFRFLACQLGITALIIVWTAIWVVVIHSYEGPNENLVNEDYVKQQDQLVVDLATELRMITPISPKWQKAIIARVDEARRQTMFAAKRGAKLEPGRYWDPAGTFLFTVFVMTALGFGAPVPQTVEGRCFALLYAVFAIPFHVYLMMQASTCAVAHVNHYLTQCQKNIRGPKVTPRGDNDVSNIRVKAYRRRKTLSRLVAVVTVGHCVPLASLVYYAIGVLIFGVGRYRQTDTVDVLMFPLQFTTNGGLASVESYFRVLYGFYVEGAMALLTCSLAALRRYSGNSVSNMTENYRLYTKG